MSNESSNKQILLLGAGYVTTTVVEYLTRNSENRLTIATRTLNKAQQRQRENAHNPQNVQIVELDIENTSHDERLKQLISQHDLVISLVPYSYHVKVAKMAIDTKTNMVTSSYISPAMRQLHEQATQAGITIMNEIGVDPGIDHLESIRVIRDGERRGGRLVEFESWCGGLPAPDALKDGNPLQYKFSWSPRGVLMAGTNEARYLKDGQTVIVTPNLLRDNTRHLNNLHKDFDFEGYPNRDSTIYRQEYNIQNAQSIIRGTLRYRGYMELMGLIKGTGLVNFESVPRDELANHSWRSVFANKVLGLKDENSSDETISEAVAKRCGVDVNSPQAKKLIDALQWMGLYSNDEPVDISGGSNLADAFSALLQKKMSYKQGERDMIFLQNQFVFEFNDGRREHTRSTLINYGDNDGKYSAMAKTTGLPCAIASQLVLDGKINRLGVFGPMYEEVNQPIIDALKKEGIAFETVVTNL